MAESGGGNPPSLQEPVRLAADRYASELDPDIIPAGVDPLTFRVQQAEFLHEVGRSLAEHRRQHPGGDMISNLLQAEVDGRTLSANDIGAFMVLMSVAGNDTTKQTTSHTVISFAKHPEQRECLPEDFEVQRCRRGNGSPRSPSDELRPGGYPRP